MSELIKVANDDYKNLKTGEGVTVVYKRRDNGNQLIEEGEFAGAVHHATGDVMYFTLINYVSTLMDIYGTYLSRESSDGDDVRSVHPDKVEMVLISDRN